MTRTPEPKPQDDETIRQLKDLVERVKRGEVSALEVLYRTASGEERAISVGEKKPGTGPG